MAEVRAIVADKLNIVLIFLAVPAEAAEVRVALNRANAFGRTALADTGTSGGAPPESRRRRLRQDDPAVLYAEVNTTLTGVARDTLLAALPSAEELLLALGRAVSSMTGAENSRELMKVVRELHATAAFAPPSATDGSPEVGVVSVGTNPNGADFAVASELISPLGPLPLQQSSAERVLDEVANVQTLWSPNTSAAAAAATVAPFVTFTNTSPEAVYKALGAFTGVVVGLLLLTFLAQTIAATFGVVMRPLARPRAQLGILKSSVGIACQVGATAIVSLDAFAIAAGGMLIVIAAGVCWLSAHIVRRALGGDVRGGAAASSLAAASLPRARFLAVPHTTPARGSRGAPSLIERLLGRASLDSGVWEDANSAGNDFVKGNGNMFEHFVGLPVDKEAQRVMPWTAASQRLPLLGIAVPSWKLRVGSGVIQMAMTALRGAIAGAGAACGGAASACSTAVLGGVGLGTIAQITLVLWLTPFIDRLRHVLDLLSNACTLASVVCAIARPHDKALVVYLQIAATAVRLLGAGNTFYKRVVKFTSTRKATRSKRRVTLARLSRVELAGLGAWDSDEAVPAGGARFSVINPLTAADGPQPNQKGTGAACEGGVAVDITAAGAGDLAGEDTEAMAAGALLESELAKWSSAMSAFSDDARPRMSVNIASPGAEGGVVDTGADIGARGGAQGTAMDCSGALQDALGAASATGSLRSRGATETHNPLYAMLSGCGGDTPSWGHAMRLLLALNALMRGDIDDADGQQTGDAINDDKKSARLESALEAIGVVADVVATVLGQESADDGGDGEQQASRHAAVWAALQEVMDRLGAVQSGAGSRAEAYEAILAATAAVRACCPVREAANAERDAAGGLLESLHELLGGMRRALRAVGLDHDPAARAAAARARDMSERAQMEEQIRRYRANLRKCDKDAIA